ncbi:MAG: bifunctional hydroxymethylpyrimidine kinase/phosphomethylpyrimidine kinase [Lachnospiraceae bacterium]
MKPTKKIALLHDLCGVGKASFTNMMPILSVMGAEVCPIPTVLLSTHTGGYGIPAMFKVDPDYITQCANHYVENRVFFDVVFIGYLGSIEMVEAVKYFISCFPDAKVIMDPIMGDKGVFYENFNQSYCSAIKSLLPYTDILLPNLTECCLMTGIEIQGNWSPQKAKTFCERLDLFHVELPVSLLEKIIKELQFIMIKSLCSLKMNVLYRIIMVLGMHLMVFLLEVF